MPQYFGLRSLLLLALLGALLCVSCSRSGNTGEVWARVDGTPIYRQQVEAGYRARQGASLHGPKPELALSLKLAILNNLIDRTLLLARAAELQITVSGKEVDTRLGQIQTPGAGFQKQMRTAGLTPAKLRKQVREDLIIQKLIEKEILSQVHVTANEIAAYYNLNKTYFDVPEAQYHLAQILVTPNPSPQVRNLMHDGAGNEREAELKIEAFYLQVRTGKDFAKVAEQYSEDPHTAPGGGDMGFVAVADFAPNPTVGRALKSLKVGQITGIIRDRSGFHIYKLLGRVNAGQRKLQDPDVQNTIRKTLTDEKVELLKAAYIENLRNRARVVDYLAEQILKGQGAASGMVNRQ